MILNAQKNPLTPEEFFEDLFSTNDAHSGGVVRLSNLDMERFIGRDRFIQEMKARKFTAMVNRGQIYIFCNNKDLHIIA
ncbi:MAG: N-(5'-phosphoribosyl)anthranilate isomerase [Aliishimia sp.]